MYIFPKRAPVLSGRYHAKMKLKVLDTVHFINKDNSNRRKSAQFLYLLVKNY